MVQKVVIVGAGPSGLLLAHYLVRRPNYHVEIYDRRSDPRTSQNYRQRSFPISLQKRGRKAIEVIDDLATAISQRGIFCTATIMHGEKGKLRKISRPNPLLTIDRQLLVEILLQQLEEYAAPERLKVQFGYECTSLDRTAKTITLQTKNAELTANYDVLIGADGARSRVRQLLTEANLCAEVSLTPDAYKSVYLDLHQSALDRELKPNCLHTWNLGNNSRMILVPQPGDRLDGVLIFDADCNPMAELSTKEDIIDFFQKHFFILQGLITPKAAEELLHRPVARITTVRCDRFHEGDSIGIIGDAAHAVSPAIGQGCNSALEDVSILTRLLDRYHDDWSQALPQFSQKRVPDAHALRELSDYAFPRTKKLVLEFIIRLKVRRFLHRLFPRLVKPFLFDLFLDSDLSYAEILDLSRGWIDKVKQATPSSKL